MTNLTDRIDDGLAVLESDRGRAVFSHCGRYRYSLLRWIAPRASDYSRRVVFVMLNPSTADAFKDDPTIVSCIKRATRLGADALHVVNLFALRSPDPDVLRATPTACRGADEVNDEQIRRACTGAAIVIAAWGNHGDLGDRARNVLAMLQAAGVKLHALKLTTSGAPSHPLARGKARIPDDAEPFEWR